MLLVEDDETDARLIVRLLKKLPYEVTSLRIWSLDALRDELTTGVWDIVLADYILTGFDALDVLEMVKSMRPDLPVIVVSGKVGEDVAVGTLVAGARDYVMKDNLRRLGPAIERELAEAAGARRRRQAEAELEEAHRRVELVISNAPILLFAVNRNGELTLTQGRALQSLGLKAGENVGRRILDLYGDIPGVREHVDRAQEGEVRKYRFEHRSGCIAGPVRTHIWG